MSKVIIKLLLVMLMGYLVNRTSGETSAEYLRKVMMELQGINEPEAAGSMAVNYYSSNDDYNYATRKQHHSNPNSMHNIAYQTSPMVTTSSIMDKYHPAASLDHQSPYYPVAAVPVPLIIPATKTRKQQEPLTFTTAELAAMYKSALERGNRNHPMSLASFAGGPSSSRKGPKITGTHIELLQNAQPGYEYYFFPLKSFVNEMHGYRIPDSHPEHTHMVHQESQKQLSPNPLFMAISSFIGMALLFMTAIMIMPKIQGFLEARSSQDELAHMTRVVSSAIESKNFSKDEATTESSSLFSRWR